MVRTAASRSRTQSLLPQRRAARLILNFARLKGSLFIGSLLGFGYGIDPSAVKARRTRFAGESRRHDIHSGRLAQHQWTSLIGTGEAEVR